MAGIGGSSLVLDNRHTGERLVLRRVLRGDEVWLELKGSLPPHCEGPPLHIHFAEDEEGHVTAGTLSAVVDGHRINAGPGESAKLPRGSTHRWWNEGDELLEFVGYARPVVDLDRYLQAVFEVSKRGFRWAPPAFLHGARCPSTPSHAGRAPHAATDPERRVPNHRCPWHGAWSLPRR